MDNPASPVPIPPKPPISLNLAFLIITLASLLLSVFFIFQNWRLNQKLNALIQSQPTPTPSVANPPLAETPPVDPTANWKTYTSEKFGFSFRYPETWKDVSDPKSATEFKIETTSNEVVLGTIFDGKTDKAKDKSWIRLDLINNKSILISYMQCAGMGCKEGSKDIAIFDQILSTFTFLNDEASSGSTQYKDVTSGYQFSYPSEWKLLTIIPQEFRYEDRYQNDYNQWVKWINTQEGLAQWLNGKMFVGQTCRGPILQNAQAPGQLIVIEIVPLGTDGGFCWSTGHFFDNNKWKVTDKYAYPVGSSNQTTIEPQWKGDFFVFRELGGNNSWKVFLGLANRETYSLKGGGAVDQILSTFKFLDQNADPEGKFCGGFAGIICPKGYECKYDGDYPDASGICIKN